MKDIVKILGIKVYERQYLSNVGTSKAPTEILINALGGNLSTAGVSVTVDTAITLSAVWRAINILSSTIASLPLKVYKTTEDGSRISLSAHPSQMLMNHPSNIMNDFIFRETMMAVLLLYGNAYAVKIKNSTTGYVEELVFIHPDDVTVYKQDNKLIYQIKGIADPVTQSEMLHIAGLSFDGLKGKSVISAMRESMGLSIAAQRFGSKFFANGANMDGVLEAPGVLSDEVYEHIRKSWDEKYAGVDNAKKTAILEAGMKYTRIGIPPEDAQFLQTRQFQVSEVARWFGVQPHLLMDLDRATNNNIEHQGMEFVTYTLMPWVARWESELNEKLISKSEQQNTYFEYNLAGILRGDSKSRSEYYRTMWGLSAISANEIRKLENQPAYEGGDQYFAQAGFVPVHLMEQYHLQKQTPNEPSK